MMFSRRHPFLFFVLVLTGMSLSAGVILSGLFVFSGQSAFERGEKVGVIEVMGVIIDARDPVEQLKAFRDNSDIKAVVIRIDSPGGAVGPSQEIYREIRKTAAKKKTVASMGALAASGGYYVASAADKVMANPGTITGSIGVIMSYTNLETLFQKIGLSPVVIKSGEYKDIASPVREMTEEERAILQKLAEDLHNQFISDVAKGRRMDAEAVKQLADGRVYTGKTAQALGLVDELGNLEDAIDLAGRLAGIKGDITSVYPPEKSTFSLIEWLTGMSTVELIHRATSGEVLYGGYLYRPGK